MTAVLPVPVPEKTDDARPVHWACIVQEGVPFFALCGDLPVQQRRTPGARLSCPGCLELIAEHCATCSACWPFSARYL